MEPDTNMVKVYGFTLYSDQHETFDVAPCLATPERIAELGGTRLEAVWREVELDELDPQGQFRRIATGWGELT